MKRFFRMYGVEQKLFFRSPDVILFNLAMPLVVFILITLIAGNKAAAGLAPLLAGLAIRFGMPLLEKTLMGFNGSPFVLLPYYGLFHFFFASLSPAMVCFIAAMVMLEERDEQIDRYLIVTGLGRKEYFASRIVIPALLAFAVTAVLLPLFNLTALSAAEIFFFSLTGTVQGVLMALLTVSFSSNKLEGMAATKLSLLMIFGAVVPFFVPSPVRFFFAFLPSFWMGKVILENDLLYALLSVFAAGSWIMLLWRVYNGKT